MPCAFLAYNNRAGWRGGGDGGSGSGGVQSKSVVLWLMLFVIASPMGKARIAQCRDNVECPDAGGLKGRAIR
jgi:hypothetical protein